MAGTAQAGVTATPWTPVGSSPFTAFMGPLTNASVVPSTTAAGATRVSYTVQFTTSSTGQLMNPGTVTLTAPAGTFTGASFQITDVTQNRSIGGGQVSNDGTTAVLSISTGTPTGAGDVLRVVVTDANNSTAGLHQFDIDTSSDTPPAAKPTYTLVAPQAVTNASVVPSTTAAGATGVSYTVQFTTSSTGQLIFPGTVTLTAPAGTFTGASFQITDVTQNRSIGGGQVSNDGTTAVLSISTGTPTGAGDVLRVVVTDANNSTAGLHQFDIDTSSDTPPAAKPTYTLVAPQAVTNASVVPSTTAAGATGVSYTVQFTTSSTGQLIFPGTVTLTAPAGTFTGASFQITDVTQNRSIGGGQVSNDGTTAVLSISTGTPTGAGDVLRVVVTDANNSTAGLHQFDIDTSSDTPPAAKPTYTLVAPQAVTNASVVPSTTAAGATGVSHRPVHDQLDGPADIPGDGHADGAGGHVHGRQLPDHGRHPEPLDRRRPGLNDGTTAVLSISTGTPTGAGDVLRVVVTDANNSTAGLHQFDIDTSSDTPPAAKPTYTLVAPQAVTNASVVPSTTAAGATGVSYTVQFTTSSTGQLIFPGTVTLTAPAGTFTGASFQITDVTQNRSIGGGQVSNDGTTAVFEHLDRHADRRRGMGYAWSSPTRTTRPPACTSSTSTPRPTPRPRPNRPTRWSRRRRSRTLRWCRRRRRRARPGSVTRSSSRPARRAS